MIFSRKPKSSGQYRVVRCWGGWEPQASYTAGTVKGLFWYPLNREGYWLEPESFSMGNPTKRSVMHRSDAHRAILRGRAINQQHVTDLNIGNARSERETANLIAMIIQDEIGGETCTPEWSRAAADRIVCALREAR